MRLPKDLEAELIAKADYVGPTANIPGEEVPVFKDDDESEKAFDRRVVAYAESRGWWSFHAYDCRRSAAGWPDRVFVRERVVYAELKAEGGRLTKDQAVMLSRLLRAGQSAYVWRPSNWAEVVEVLA